MANDGEQEKIKAGVTEHEIRVVILNEAERMCRLMRNLSEEAAARHILLARLHRLLELAHYLPDK